MFNFQLLKSGSIYILNVKNSINRFNLTLFIQIISIILINYRAGISQKFCESFISGPTANLIANNDTSICPGESVILNTYNSVIDPCWLNDPSLSFTNGKTIAKPSTTTTYTVSARRFVNANLVEDGSFTNFSNNNRTFKSDYKYSRMLKTPELMKGFIQFLRHQIHFILPFQDVATKPLAVGI